MEYLTALLPWKNDKKKKKQEDGKESPLRVHSNTNNTDYDEMNPASCYEGPHDQLQAVAVLAAERLKHQRRLDNVESSIFDCVCPIWVITFLLVAVVSFTPLFSSFMAIYVVRQRVNSLVPKNLNVTAVDAAFIFESTLGNPIRLSASEIVSGLYNRLQKDEWNRREAARLEMGYRGTPWGYGKYDLPTMTKTQRQFIDDLCNGWREQIDDPMKINKKPKRGTNYVCEKTGATPYCRWNNKSQDWWKIPPSLRKDLINYLDNNNSSSSSNSQQMTQQQELDGFNVFSKRNSTMSAAELYALDEAAHQKLVQNVELQQLYTAIDSIVRRSPIGRDFTGQGFVMLWGVDMNESGFLRKDLAQFQIEELEAYRDMTGSDHLPFLCGWKHAGLKTARTAYSVTDIPRKTFANFSFLSPTVPWGTNAAVVESCSLMCSTSFFALFNITPPTSGEPRCSCTPPKQIKNVNGTVIQDDFYKNANYDNSVTVLRPTPKSNIPSLRPNPFPTTASQNDQVSIVDATTGRRVSYPHNVANYSNYLWVDAAQTVDTYTLTNNISAGMLVPESVARAASPYLNEYLGWMAYNLSFNVSFATIVNTPVQLKDWPSMMDVQTARSTLLDTTVAASAFAVRTVTPPAFEIRGGRTRNCAVPRWFYSYERAPAPCGQEKGFVPDALTLYRVTPVTVRRSMIRDTGAFQDSPVRVANVVVGRRIPIGLIQKIFWPLARQSAFQFSLVDATTMTEITCVDGTNEAASTVFGGVTGKVRAVWSLVWNTLAVYLPDKFVPLTWRFPFTSEILSADKNNDWFNARSADATDVDEGLFGPLPPSARCQKSTAGMTLDILTGRTKLTTGPFIDADTKHVLTSIEDFTDVPRVVFSEAYLYAFPIKLEQRDHNARPFNPTDDLERISCEEYALDEASDDAFNRNSARPTTQGLSPSQDVKCGSGNNKVAADLLARMQNSMRIEAEENRDQQFLTSNNNRLTPPPSASEPFKSKKNKGNLYIFVSLQSRDLLELVLQSRSQVVVTSAVCAFIIVIALFVIVRGLTSPVKQLRRVLQSCTDLTWDKMTPSNASIIAEVLEMQYAMSYITVKMQSFARFLPPGLKQFGETAQRAVRVDAKSRRIFSTLEEGGSSSSDDDGEGGKENLANYRVVDSSNGMVEHKIFADATHDDLEDDLDYENQVNENEMKELEFSGRSTNYARQLSYSLMGPSGVMRARKEAKRAQRQAWKRPSMFHHKRGHDRETLPVMTAERLGLSHELDAVCQETPLHSIYVNVSYEGVPIDIWAEESEKVQRRVLTGEYVKDHNMAARHNIWDEKPLLTTKFLLKYRATDPLIALVARASREVLQERPGETLLIFVDTPDGKQQVVHNEDLLFAFEQHASRGTLSPIELTVAKKKPSTSLTLLIAFLMIGGTLSRIGLAFNRMGMDLEERVRLIGVLLIAALTMQVAANTLWYVYLMHKMSKKDLEFHMWRQVSVTEERIGFLFSIFGIANMEILGCQKRFGHHDTGVRFTAPFNDALLKDLRQATIYSFIFSDFFPLVILWVETVLRQSYDDVVLWFTTIFCIFGILAVLRRHGMLTMIVNVKPQGDRKPGPFVGKSQGTASLSRKEATVVRLRLAHYDALLSTLDMHHVDTLCESIYSIVSPLVRSAGGIMIRADGLSFTVIFNAASNTPHHAAAAFSFVSLVSLAIKKHMSPLLAIHAQRYWQLRKEDVPLPVLQEYCARWHRVVAGIVTAEMSVGYSGSAQLRTYQHADWTNQFAGALADLAEHYGAEILVNDQAATQLTIASEPTGVLARRPALVRHIDMCGLGILDPEISRLMGESQASEYPRHLKKAKVFEALGRGLPIHNTWKVPRELGALYSSGFMYPFDDACSALILAYARVNGGYEAAGSQQQSAAAVKLMETAAVKLALNKFESAMEQVFVNYEPRLLQQYCKEFPLDEVAARVLRWARFFGSPNQSEGIVYPRLISGMGVQPHPCELLHGVGSQNASHAHAQARKTVRFQTRITGVMNPHHHQQQQQNNQNQQDRDIQGSGESIDSDDVHFHEAFAQSRRFFDLAPLVRPPRSERRHHNSRYGSSTDVGGAGTGLIEHVLDQKQFVLNFVDRRDDEPVHEL